MVQKLAMFPVALAFVGLFGSTAWALTISDASVVGWIKGGEQNASTATETTAGNHLLAMDALDTDANGPGFGSPDCDVATDDGCYATSAMAIGGSLSGAQQFDGTSVAAGWDYVMAKYDGPEGGWVLWFIGGSAATLPADSAPLWMNPAGQEGLGLSHYTVFNPRAVPDGGSLVLLLGAALGAVEVLRRRVVRS